MKLRTETVLGVEGVFYSGEIPDTACFVPISMIHDGQLDKPNYVAQGWAALNNEAQPPELRMGSHMFPELRQPADPSIAAAVRTRLQRMRPQPLGA